MTGAEHMVEQLGRVDVGAVAEFVVANPRRNAISVSTIEIEALALRLRDLERAAGEAFGLLSSLDALTDIGCAGDQAVALRSAVQAHLEALSSALAELGYVPMQGVLNDPAHI